MTQDVQNIAKAAVKAVAHAAAGTVANPLRGEGSLIIDGTAQTLRPTFTALITAEEELGPLIALVERAGDGKLSLAEIASLFWHCLTERGTSDTTITRDMVGEAVLAQGLAAIAKPLRNLLGQILKGAP